LIDEKTAAASGAAKVAIVAEPPQEMEVQLVKSDVVTELAVSCEGSSAMPNADSAVVVSAATCADASVAPTSDSAVPMDPLVAAGAIADLKRGVESKEKTILSVMARRQADLNKEKRALDMIRAEMQALSQQQSKEILDVMTRLGETDKDLWYLERDFKAAEAEYLKCKARYEKMKQAKTELAVELTKLTLNAEKRKEEKLNSIMEKLKNDGVVFPGAALANLAE